MGVGEVPCLFDGLDDDVLFLFLDWVKGLVFLKVRVVVVHVGVGRGVSHLVLGRKEGLQCMAVASAVESVCEMVFVFDEGGRERFEFGSFC